jgi:hypothetical protein
MDRRRRARAVERLEDATADLLKQVEQFANQASPYDLRFRSKLLFATARKYAAYAVNRLHRV